MRGGTRPVPRAIGFGVCAIAAAWVAACQYLPSLHDTTPGTQVPGLDPSATVQILVSTADRSSPGAVLPVTILAEWKAAAADGGTVGCVALTGAPGTVAFPLPSVCSGAGAEGGSAVSSEGGTTLTQCVAFNAKAPDGIQGGQAIASYTPTGTESAATLFAALYATADCTGPQIASNSAFEVLTMPGAEAGAEASVEEDASDAGTADSPGSADAPGGDDGSPGDDAGQGDDGGAADGGPGSAGDAGDAGPASDSGPGSVGDGAADGGSGDAGGDS